MPASPDDPVGLYVHWPFCKSKCPYCDFNSHVRDGVDHQAWRDALLAEMAHAADQSGPRRLHSIFFGGGTPSLMQPETVAAVIARAKELWSPEPDLEITLEANPTSVEAGKFAAFADAGVNRVSLGVQSLRAGALAFLGRQHDADQALAAVEMAAKHFPRFSFDLIYARPGQTLAEWREELRAALPYTNGHLSLYQLTIEPGTAFHTDHRLGRFEMPDEDLAAAFFEETQSILDRHGMPAYEVSNHARPGEESRHNLVYWRYQDYLGIGPGAHGRLTVGGEKFAQRRYRLPEKWLQAVNDAGHALEEEVPLSTETQRDERVMMGLRLTEGVAAQGLDADRIGRLADEGYITRTAARIAATNEGRLRLNSVIDFLLA